MVAWRGNPEDFASERTMSTAADWLTSYVRQADADWRAWELYEKHPEAVAAECHKLLFLQMACEKLCKAHLIWKNSSPRELQTSHAYIANVLPLVVRQQILEMRQDLTGMQGVIQHVRCPGSTLFTCTSTVMGLSSIAFCRAS